MPVTLAKLARTLTTLIVCAAALHLTPTAVQPATAADDLATAAGDVATAAGDFAAAADRPRKRRALDPGET